MPPFPLPMPGAGAPPAGAPPGGTGAASAPQAMQGSKVQAIEAVKAGLEILQKALPGLPMGDDLHTAVLKAIGEISKHVSKGEGDAGSIVQQLAQLARQQSQNPPAMMRPPAPPSGGTPPIPAAT